MVSRKGRPMTLTVDQLMTAPQVCQALGVSRQTWHTWQIPPDWVSPGGKPRYWARATIAQLAVDRGRREQYDAFLSS